jgi:hypothetical protein
MLLLRRILKALWMQFVTFVVVVLSLVFLFIKLIIFCYIIQILWLSLFSGKHLLGRPFLSLVVVPLKHYYYLFVLHFVE